jgi:signal transduction histidine kinase
MGTNHLLHEMELSFFGTISASVSHELNNVLSIINEYAGLLDDLVTADKKGIPFENEKIKKIALNISEQIKRQQEIIKLLNRFAHRVDTPIVQFVLNDLVYDIIRLSQRFASLKKVSLAFTIPQDPLNIINNPFAVQHAIFSCLNLALDFSNKNDRITTLLDKEEEQATIKISCRPIDKTEDAEKKLKCISYITDNIGGKINLIFTNDDRQIISLFIPLSVPDSRQGQNKGFCK